MHCALCTVCIAHLCKFNFNLIAYSVACFSWIRILNLKKMLLRQFRAVPGQFSLLGAVDLEIPVCNPVTRFHCPAIFHPPHPRFGSHSSLFCKLPTCAHLVVAQRSPSSVCMIVRSISNVNCHQSNVKYQIRIWSQ